MSFDPLRPVPCVYFKHGAYWYVKRGKWERIGKTLEDALAEYARRVETPKGGMGELIDRVYAQHAPSLAKSTKDQYRAAADILKRKLRPFAPDQVKSKHVAKVKQDLAATPNMANRALSFLRVVFSYAVEWQEVDSNPCVGIKRLPEARRKRLLTAQEWQAIHNAAPLRLKVVMRLQFLTGQRINDVLTVRRNQITEAGLQFTQQKTGKRMTVKWSDDLRTAVADAQALAGPVPSLYLLPGKKGKPPNYRSVALQFEKARIAAGVEDARLNDQRAQSLTEAKRQGMNATALAGHSSPAMTERYLRDRETPVVSGPLLRKRPS